jgi:type IV secretory pathway VirB10-like protein
MAGAPKSPDSLQLRGSPLASARLSKKAALFTVGAFSVILGFIIVNVSKERPTPASAENAQQKTLQPAMNAANTLTKDVPAIAPEIDEPVEQPAPRLPASTQPAVAREPVRTSEDEARMADTAIAKFHDDGGRIQPASLMQSASDAVGGNLVSRRDAYEEEDEDEPDLNRQAQKLAFLRQKHESVYLDSRLKAPRSDFEIKTGTVIPSILVTELNSDLPGEIVAQVSQNVYDTATGKHLLIPQGAKLFGRYDSQVAFGQGRLLVSWQRLIYPNAHTIELDGMSGHDSEGKAGFSDRVNNHYGRLFGFALLTSTLTAAYQLSQPEDDRSADRLPSDREVAAGAVGQQMTQLGLEIARRNLRVQPTVEVRKGYRLNVMVNKDVIFPASYQP